MWGCSCPAPYAGRWGLGRRDGGPHPAVVRGIYPIHPLIPAAPPPDAWGRLRQATSPYTTIGSVSVT